MIGRKDEFDAIQKNLVKVKQMYSSFKSTRTLHAQLTMREITFSPSSPRTSLRDSMRVSTPNSPVHGPSIRTARSASVILIEGDLGIGK